MRLRFLSCLLSALAVLAVAPAAKAAIVLQHDGGVALGSTGLFKFIVSAVATENEVITAFNKLSVTGGHHVYDGLVNNPTPFIENASGTLWNPAWTPYDTHVTIPL
jgi:hypothetical protein